MTELSPAAKAVLDAYIRGLATKRRNAIAAALRVAADLTAPDDYKCFTGNLEWDAGMEARTDAIRENLLAIANELEAQ